MKSLIIGANGMVGTALSRQLPNAIKTVRFPDPIPTRFEIFADITKYETLFDIFSNYRPEVVYLTAYNTDVDKCENPETNATNVRGPSMVLRLCEQFESKLIFFSTSYVFDGKSKYPYEVGQPTNPINNYGKQKNTVEGLILSSYAKFVIVRSVGIFGPDSARKNFVNRVSDAVTSGKKVFVPNDQFMNPILSTDLARIVVRLARDAQGVFHVSGRDCMTKYEWALEVAKYFDSERLIVPVSSKEMKQAAIRPRMGCLETPDAFEVTDFRVSLNRFLDSEVFA